MTVTTPTQQFLANRLFTVGAVQFGQFKLKLHEQHPDAPLSPIFFNLRTPDNPKPGPLDPELVQLIAAEMVAIFPPRQQFQGVAGVPRAGDPFAAAAAKLLRCPRLQLAKSETAERRSVTQLVGGLYHIDDTIVVIDDLITAADSKLEAIRIFLRYGLLVRDVVTLLDRQQGGRELLLAAGVQLRSVFTASQLLNHYRDTSAITTEQHAAVADYWAGSAGGLAVAP